MKKLIALLLLSASTVHVFAATDIWGKGEVPRITDPADVPRTLEAIWSGYEKSYDKYNPLEAVIHKTWEVDDGAIVVNWVELTVGHFQGQKTIVCGYWVYPKGAKRMPTIVLLNGGPQTAGEQGAINWAHLGYACFHPNHNQDVTMQGEADGLPNTDWGALNAVSNPGPLGPMNPSDETIDAVPSPRNNWQFPRQISGRRIISFLEKQPQVNPKKIGVRGHSTGGKWTVYMSIDPRVAAAVPSVGGAGGANTMHPILEGISQKLYWEEEWVELLRDTVDPQAYWRIMHAPILHLGASNDFNAPDWHSVQALKLANVDKRYVTCANFNHAFPPETMIADYLWFEDQLKGTFDFPKAPSSELILDRDDGIPVFRIKLPKTKLKLIRVEMYYTDGRNPIRRFWITGDEVQNEDGSWECKTPLTYDDEPLMAFANAVYEIDPIDVPNHSYNGKSEMAVSSDYAWAWPDDLQAAGIKTSLERIRMIDDFSRGLRDWNGDLGNGYWWSIETQKVSNPRFVGPRGAELVFEVNVPEAGQMIGLKVDRQYMNRHSGEHLFYKFIELPQKGWNTVRVKPGDLRNNFGWPLDDWQKIYRLALQSPASLKQQVDGDLASRAKHVVEHFGDKQAKYKSLRPGAVPDKVSGWDESYYREAGEEYVGFNMSTKNDALAKKRFRNMRWEGGSYEGITKSRVKEPYVNPEQAVQSEGE